ncbi:SDR family NAD(P)-dependent oxidoreductase [Phyllobacterium leguminum]|uniref:NAD(P)-dependent dehydrogenase (Short-subunit alcohol dehydrogenase family) n=1 Tax=Phyllobacterium leguminum TaxID=314237 RepID=A0A318T146_9HYPH|nr:SDR family oxidoreductase [Phyllobacterium leguminum]PYE86299.1 NAD(P)-dependent dehydrogenase (short-subunit alcohol dehydrogenase family) [Phyllobacterium leguminum]
MIDGALFSVAGKTIAVTGGSSGLGLRMVDMLAKHGANVISISRAHAPERNRAGGGEIIDIMADVTSPEEVGRAFDEAEARLGTVTVVFNNAGVAQMARALDTTREMLKAVFDVNVGGAFCVAQEAARRLIAAGKAGTIVNSTSILAERPLKGAVAYAMSKAAVSHMTRALALEWATHDIRVNAIAPGWFPTRLNEAVMEGPGSGFLKGINPLRRLGEVQDLDGAVLMLASDASRYMTGAIVTIDGGHSI